jgi:hypothetical protein
MSHGLITDRGGDSSPPKCPDRFWCARSLPGREADHSFQYGAEYGDDDNDDYDDDDDDDDDIDNNNNNSLEEDC